MARHPDWFERLDSITEAVRQADPLDWFGRNEIKAVFACSERDSIRLLHKFGAVEQNNALLLPRSSLLAQLEAIRRTGSYAAFLQQRRDIAGQLTAARAEAAARRPAPRADAPPRRFPVPAAAPDERQPSFEDLPKTITWRRAAAGGPGRLEVLYADGADLMRQLAPFLSAAGLKKAYEKESVQMAERRGDEDETAEAGE